MPVPEDLHPLGESIERELTLVLQKDLTHLIGGRLLAGIGIESLGSPASSVLPGAGGIKLAHDLGHEFTGDIAHDLLDALQDLHIGAFQSVASELIHQFREQGSTVRSRVADALLALLLLEQGGLRQNGTGKDEKAEPPHHSPAPAENLGTHFSGFLPIPSCCPRRHLAPPGRAGRESTRRGRY